MPQLTYSPTTRYAMVSMPRGSWRWQNAYKVVAYRAYVTRDGRSLWRSHHDVTGKMSEPQLRRLGWTDIHNGSLHNRPVAA